MVVALVKFGNLCKVSAHLAVLVGIGGTLSCCTFSSTFSCLVLSSSYVIYFSCLLSYPLSCRPVLSSSLVVVVLSSWSLGDLLM